MNKEDTFQIELNSEISYLIGVYIGDGFFNKYNHNYVFQLSGHSVLDYNHYVFVLIPIIKRNFPNLNPILRKYGNTLRLTINSKYLFIFLSKRFNFKPGKKADIIKIPDEILNSNVSILNMCIRGIFDTDGSIYFDKRTIYKKSYIRIGLHMISKNLLIQIHEILLKQGIKSTLTKNYRKLQINGFENCKLFCKIIGFNNKRHLNKLKMFF